MIKKKFKFFIECNCLNFRDIAKKVEALGYKLSNATVADVDALRHRFGCFGKSRTAEEDYAILNEVKGVGIVYWREIKVENSNA